MIQTPVEAEDERIGVLLSSKNLHHHGVEAESNLHGHIKIPGKLTCSSSAPRPSVHIATSGLPVL